MILVFNFYKIQNVLTKQKMPILFCLAEQKAALPRYENDTIW